MSCVCEVTVKRFFSLVLTVPREWVTDLPFQTGIAACLPEEHHCCHFWQVRNSFHVSITHCSVYNTGLVFLRISLPGIFFPASFLSVVGSPGSYVRCPQLRLLSAKPPSGQVWEACRCALTSIQKRLNKLPGSCCSCYGQAVLFVSSYALIACWHCDTVVRPLWPCLGAVKCSFVLPIPARSRVLERNWGINYFVCVLP
jgi:hypothetical protein